MPFKERDDTQDKKIRINMIKSESLRLDTPKIYDFRLEFQVRITFNNDR